MSPCLIHLNLRALLHLLLPFLLPMDNRKDNPNPNSSPDHNDLLPEHDEHRPTEEEQQHGENCGGIDEDEDDNEEEENGETEEEDVDETEVAPRAASLRTPFTDLSQVDADLALARTLQEQERAYMMLRMRGADAGGYGASELGSDYELDHEDEDEHDLEDHGSVEGSDYDNDEDAFDAQESEEEEIDPSAYSDDEAYARALQDAEERNVATRLMALAGINDWVAEEREDHGSNSQDTWQDVDPDDFSYEELMALGEAVGTESRGLSADLIASLPSVSYKAQNSQDDNTDQCVICRLDYEDGDSLNILPCKHTYHSECINKWLQINKVCPVCSAEVSTSETRQG